ncbi:FkbM family methyltransferase [Pedobacter fastidiosus]|uniref:FkbM family methyltransferase n=1 Tax=Pedobacter fastidiosus TaxID=2765361 RepID=A0ABR7KVN9_9SPHI|nr:FkbM family methyltransferase [Pedobacter fastidiosus]MBC6112174.1 FkbM family methyltransferase [Pedobacter fastidiosus]
MAITIAKIKSFRIFSLTEKISLISELYFNSTGKIKNLIHSRFLLEKLYQINSKILKADHGFIVKNLNGISSFVRKKTSDSYVFKQIFLDQEYLPLLKLIEQNKISVNTILDCGANVGYTTTYLIKAFPTATIYCIEPDFENSNCIKQNIKLNDLQNTTVINKGVWGKKAFLKITKDFRDGESWSFSLVEVKEERDSDVTAITLSQLINQYNIQTIDILKIDIEGAERYLFENDEETAFFLSRTKCIAIEIHDEYESREMITSKLLKNGFKLQNSGELTMGYK